MPAEQGIPLLILVEGGDLRIHGSKQDRYSGFTRYWIPALQMLSEHGYEVAISSLRGHLPIDEPAAEFGWRTSILDAGSSFSYPLVVRRLRTLIRRHGIRVVHASEAIPGAIAGLAVAATPTRSIFHKHHVEAHGAQRFFTAVADRTSDLIMPVSNAAVEKVIEANIPREKVHLAHNGVIALRHVAQEELSRLREQSRIPPTPPLLLVVAHLRPEKGHEVLIEAAAEIAEEFPQTQIVFVGDGPDRRRLETLTERSSLRISFVGHQADIAPWFHLASIVLIPSLKESFGLVAIEAMSASKPIVASSAQGLPEVVIDQETGLLFSPGDPRELAQAVKSLLRDESAGRRMGEAGHRRYLEHFSLEQMVQAWIAAYEMVLDGKHR